MPTWIIEGVDRNTGANQRFSVQADDEKSALSAAAGRGTMVSAIKKASAPPPAPPPATAQASKSLRACKDCGKSISRRAKSCPSCGALPPKDYTAAVGCIVSVVAIFVVLFVATIFTDIGAPSKTPAPEVAEELIEVKPFRAVVTPEDGSASYTPEGQAFVREMLAELDDFRKTEMFAMRGFAAGGLGGEWLNAMEDAPEDVYSQSEMNAITALRRMAAEYLSSNGRDNDVTIEMRREVESVLNLPEQ